MSTPTPISRTRWRKSTRANGSATEHMAERAAKAPSARRAIGIDPGTARLGYAVVEEQRSALTLIICGVIETSAGVPMPQRLLRLYHELSRLVREYAPPGRALEELFFPKNAP